MATNSTLKPNDIISIVIAEDHELTRDGLVYNFEKNDTFSILAVTDNGQHAVELVKENNPDIILMDIGMPILDGIEATKEIKIKYPNTKVLILTSHNEDELVLKALSSGADAYCMKDRSASELMSILQVVHSGGIYLDPSIASMVLNEATASEKVFTKSPKSTRKQYNMDLTEREVSVLREIANGKSNKEIALELNISIHTVKAHVANLIQKMAVDDRTQMAIKAIKDNMV